MQKYSSANFEEHRPNGILAQRIFKICYAKHLGMDADAIRRRDSYEEKFTLRTSVVYAAIFFMCASFHQTAYAWAPFKGKAAEGKKIYLGPVPIQETEAYRKFLESSRSEIDKLYYLGDRIRAKEARSIVYIYERDRFNWAEVYAGGLWCLWHYYKRGKTAREFVREISERFERPGSRATLELPDSSVHYAYHVAINELDLLENTLAEEKS